MSALVLTSMPKSWGGAPLGVLTPAYAAIAALLAFSTGIIQIGLSWLRLGFLATLISEPVFTGASQRMTALAGCAHASLQIYVPRDCNAGFVSGAAFLSVAGQVTTMLGIPKCGKANAAGLNGYGERPAITKLPQSPIIMLLYHTAALAAVRAS